MIIEKRRNKIERKPNKSNPVPQPQCRRRGGWSLEGCHYPMPFTENLRSDMSKIYKMIYGVKSDCCYISEIIELECAKNTLIIAMILVEDKSPSDNNKGEVPSWNNSSKNRLTLLLIFGTFLHEIDYFIPSLSDFQWLSWNVQKTL